MEHHVLRDWLFCFSLVVLAYVGLIVGAFLNTQRRVWKDQKSMRRAFEASQRTNNLP